MKRLPPKIPAFEAKQVGILYHYTYLIYALQIVEENVMKAGELHQSVSFTRDKNFHQYSFIYTEEGRDVRFVIDGDKLSNNYAIHPVDYFGSLFGKSSKVNPSVEFQAEERVASDIQNIDRYIISIDLPEPDPHGYVLTTIGDSISMLKDLIDISDREQYIEMEEQFGMILDAKEYFENKGFKVKYYK